MKHEVHTCDRCGRSAATDEEKAELGLGDLVLGFDGFTGFNGRTQVYTAHKLWRKEWCHACRKELGCLSDEVHQAAQQDKPVTSLEDLVREMMREEMRNVAQ